MTSSYLVVVAGPDGDPPGTGDAAFVGSVKISLLVSWFHSFTVLPQKENCVGPFCWLGP